MIEEKITNKGKSCNVYFVKKNSFCKKEKTHFMTLYILWGLSQATIS